MDDDRRSVETRVARSLLTDNDRIAQLNRDDLRATGVTAINLLGAPGCGKTAIVEVTAVHERDLRIAALIGDVVTPRDAERLESKGIVSRPLTREGGCHVEAYMVREALPSLLYRGVEVLFIENVGSLTCPFLYDLGQRANVVALSVTQGADLPLKYPHLFRKADLVLLTKVDLLSRLHVAEVVDVWEGLRATMPMPRLLMLSTNSGQGVDEWCAWLSATRSEAGSLPGHATV